MAQTGAVGTTFFRILEQRYAQLPAVKALASSRSAGKRISLGDRELVVEETTEESFAGVDVAFISVSSEVSRRFAPAAVAAGAVVIDDGSAFRMRDDVPLVAPEVNGADVEWHQGIISIPNCSTTPLVMAAHPLHRVNPIVRIIADTYQSVSGAGGAPMEELREQSRDLIEGREAQPRALDQQIAFNLIPRIDSFLDSGYTMEEQKMRQETRQNHARTGYPDFRYLRPRAGIRIAQRGGARGIRAAHAARGGAAAFVGNARGDGAGRPDAERLPDAVGRERGPMKCSWGAFARMRPIRMALPCGSWRTTSEKAQP